MPWVTPTLEALRSLNKSNIQSQLSSGAIIPNSVLRVMADSNAGLAYLTLLYINWLAVQLMPDTAESAYLDRFGAIWLTQGRKTATFASGVVLASGTNGKVIPTGSILDGAVDTVTGVAIPFVTVGAATLGAGPTNVNVAAVLAGNTGMVTGSSLSFRVGIAGVNGSVSVSTLVDGIETETDDQLRVRLLSRIQQPPTGGDSNDYVQWAMATPGVNVTRAWCSPLAMGIGTIVVYFMTDNLITNAVGFPSSANITTVQTYIDTVRPVAIKDRWILSPIPEPINFTISNLTTDSVATRNAIAAAVSLMLYQRAAPAHSINGVSQSGTTIYAAWVNEAIASVASVNTFTLMMADHPMPTNSSLAVLGTIVYA